MLPGKIGFLSVSYSSYSSASLQVCSDVHQDYGQRRRVTVSVEVILFRFSFPNKVFLG